MNASRDISQKSFSPIQSEIFASQKQSRPEFKDRQHNYNNYIKSPLFSPKEEATLQESTVEAKEDGREEIQKLKEHSHKHPNVRYWLNVISRFFWVSQMLVGLYADVTNQQSAPQSRWLNPMCCSSEPKILNK